MPQKTKKETFSVKPPEKNQPNLGKGRSKNAAKKWPMFSPRFLWEIPFLSLLPCYYSKWLDCKAGDGTVFPTQIPFRSRTVPEISGLFLFVGFPIVVQNFPDNIGMSRFRTGNYIYVPTYLV